MRYFNKRMTKSYLTIFLNAYFLISLNHLSFAQNVLESNAVLLDASIYSRGAELHHKTNQVRIPSGNSELVINKVSQNVDPQSIRVLSSNPQLTILSVSFEIGRASCR